MLACVWVGRRGRTVRHVREEQKAFQKGWEAEANAGKMCCQRHFSLKDSLVKTLVDYFAPEHFNSLNESWSWGKTSSMSISFKKWLLMDCGKDFVIGTPSMPLNTHAFIPPLYSLSLFIIAPVTWSVQNVDSTSYKSAACILTDRLGHKVHINAQCVYLHLCVHLSMYTQIYVCIRLGVSAIDPALSHIVSLKDRGKMFWHIPNSWLPSRMWLPHKIE